MVTSSLKLERHEEARIEAIKKVIAHYIAVLQDTRTKCHQVRSYFSLFGHFAKYESTNQAAVSLRKRCIDLRRKETTRSQETGNCDESFWICHPDQQRQPTLPECVGLPTSWIFVSRLSIVELTNKLISVACAVEGLNVLPKSCLIFLVSSTFALHFQLQLILNRFFIPVQLNILMMICHHCSSICSGNKFQCLGPCCELGQFEALPLF